LSRTRFRNAERKQRRADDKWDAENNRWIWHKYAKCGLCDTKFVVNNYPDKKVRVNQHKVGNVILCGWCKTRHGTFVVQLLKIAQQLTLEDCWAQPKSAWEPDTCKCLPCVARRILQKNGKLTIGMK